MFAQSIDSYRFCLLMSYRFAFKFVSDMLRFEHIFEILHET